jgi:hypothetical protein
MDTLGRKAVVGLLPKRRLGDWSRRVGGLVERERRLTKPGHKKLLLSSRT